MDLKEKGEEIWQELHRMHENVRILRTINNQIPLCPCAFDKHVLFFIEVRLSLLDGLILGIVRMTDKRSDALSFNRIFLEIEKNHSAKYDTKKVKYAKEKFTEFAGSPAITNIKKIRHNIIAHRNVNLNSDEHLARVTYGEVYGAVKLLCEIFNLVSDAGVWNGHMFGVDQVYVQPLGFRNLEEDITSLTEALEKQCHSDERHALIMEREKTLKEEDESE